MEIKNHPLSSGLSAVTCISAYKKNFKAFSVAILPENNIECISISFEWVGYI